MAKKTYTVKSAVEHDLERYEAGSTIVLEDKEAAALLDVKAIEGPTGDATVTEPTDPAERIAAITTAIGQLDPADSTLFTGAGVPKTESIIAITGWPVTAKERDAVWAQINASK